MWDERDEQNIIFFRVFCTLSLRKKIKCATMKVCLMDLLSGQLYHLLLVFGFVFFPFRFSLRKRYYGQLSRSSSS